MSETNKLIKCSFTWTVVMENYSSQLKSPFFVSNVSGEAIKWQLTVHYNRSRDGDIQYEVKLNCLTDYSTEREVSFTIHLIKGENIVKTHKYRFNYPQGYSFNDKSLYKCGEEKFYRINSSDRNRHGRIMIKDLSLKIICDIMFQVPTVGIYDNCSTTSTDQGFKKFDNLKNFFDSDKLSDVKIVAGGEEFRAHKLILSLRSKVFAAMFSHDMQEKTENVVRIEDVDADVMREMLRFVYVDKIQEKDKLTGDLLAVADKYEIDDLKDWCEQELVKAVNLDNFHSLFALADLHRAQKLKKHLVEFLAKKTEECS